MTYLKTFNLPQQKVYDIAIRWVERQGFTEIESLNKIEKEQDWKFSAHNPDDNENWDIFITKVEDNKVELKIRVAIKHLNDTTVNRIILCIVLSFIGFVIPNYMGLDSHLYRYEYYLFYWQVGFCLIYVFDSYYGALHSLPLRFEPRFLPMAAAIIHLGIIVGFLIIVLSSKKKIFKINPKINTILLLIFGITLILLSLVEILYDLTFIMKDDLFMETIFFPAAPSFFMFIGVLVSVIWASDFF